MPEAARQRPTSPTRGRHGRLGTFGRYIGDHLVSAMFGLVVAGMAGLAVAYVQGWFSSGEQTVTSVRPDGRNCPSDFPVKGNVSEDGERIYHLPGWRYYQATYADQCFADTEASEDAGFRASKVQ